MEHKQHLPLQTPNVQLHSFVRKIQRESGLVLLLFSTILLVEVRDGVNCERSGVHCAHH